MFVRRKIVYKYDLMFSNKTIKYEIVRKISLKKLKICHKSLYVYN